MKTKNLIAVIAAALLSSCMPQKEVAGDVSFSREDFQTTKELSNPQEIAIDSLLNPAGFRVMNDSVLVVAQLRVPARTLFPEHIAAVGTIDNKR